MSSPKFKSHENNTLKIKMSDNYENHSEDNWKVSHHFIKTCYFNFYNKKQTLGALARAHANARRNFHARRSAPSVKNSSVAHHCSNQ
jgi:hypothetical protein